jgi:predicted NBD/HSP70 family sugar kinase
MRVANAWSVLSALRHLGTASRSQLSEATGLTAMTVHRLIGGLQQRDLVMPAGMASEGGVGRPSTLFRFNPGAGTVLGIDVGNETVRVALADLAGARIRGTERPTSAVEPDLAGRLLAIVGQLVGTGPPSGPLVGAAIGVPAVPSDTGRIVRASQHHGWEGLELGGAIENALGCPVLVRQDDHLAAFAELTSGACRGARSAVVLNVGKGIGVGLVFDGVVHTGGHQAAGRVAWIPTTAPDSATDGDVVRVADVLTADGLIADYRSAGGPGRARVGRDVFAADAAGDSAAIASVDRFAERLGWIMAAVMAIVDPELLVFGGGISGAWDRLERGTTARVRAILPSAAPIVASTLGSEAVVTGAVDAAMELGDSWLRARLDAPPPL